MRHTPGRGRCGRSRPTGDHRAPSVGGTGGRVDRAPSVGGTGGRVDRAPSVGGTGGRVDRAPGVGGPGGPCRGPPVQQMKRYVLVRALYSVVTLWLLVTIIFGLVRLTRSRRDEGRSRRGPRVRRAAQAPLGPGSAARSAVCGLRRPTAPSRLRPLVREVAAGAGHLFRAVAELPQARLRGIPDLARARRTVRDALGLESELDVGQRRQGG